MTLTCWPRLSASIVITTVQSPGTATWLTGSKLLARAHQTAVWERTRQVLRMRSILLEYFPAAVQAFADLAAPDALALLGRAPDPDRAAKLIRGQLVSALRTARRHHVEVKAGGSGSWSGAPCPTTSDDGACW